MRARGLAVLLFAAAAAGVARADPPAAPPPPASPRTIVAPHSGVPIEPGKNVLWCATVQLAWDAFGKAFGDERARLGKPADPATTSELDRRPFPTADLDPSAFVVAAGVADEAFVARVRTEVRKTLGPDARPPLVTATRLPTAYAHLRRSLSFEHAFRVHPSPVRFAGGTKNVVVFGLPAYSLGPQAEKIAAQAVVYVRPSRDRDPSKAPPLVLELLPKDRGERIFLAAIPPAATLEETWAATEALLKQGERHPFEPGPLLSIPRIDLDLERRFPELAPVEVLQDVRFRLDEEGALLESRAMASCSVQLPVSFDRPFLVAIQRTGASRPYFLLWVGNDDLLVADRRARIGPEALRPLLGSWVLDAEATLDGAEGTWRATGGEDGDRAAWRREVASHLARVRISFVVGEGGRVRWTQRADGPDAPPGFDVSGELWTTEAGVGLVVETVAGEAREGDRDPVPILLRPNGSLVVAEQWVLRRER